MHNREQGGEVWAVKPKPEFYRLEAERCRQLAEAIPDAEAKQHMLDVARQYEKLAVEAESKG